VGMDINKPDIDFVKLAESMGVTAYRADTVEQVELRVIAAFDHDGPTLIESSIAPEEWENK